MRFIVVLGRIEYQGGGMSLVRPRPTPTKFDIFCQLYFIRLEQQQRKARREGNFLFKKI